MNENASAAAADTRPQWFGHPAQLARLRELHADEPTRRLFAELEQYATELAAHVGAGPARASTATAPVGAGPARDPDLN